MARLALSSAPRSVYWVLGALGVLTVLGLIRTFWNSGPDADGASQPPLVTVLEVRPADLADVVTFTGAIAARDEAAISPRVRAVALPRCLSMWVIESVVARFWPRSIIL